MTATDRFKGWATLFFGAGADSLLGGFTPSGIAYIASNGSDTAGDGSPAKPFQTVAKALQSEFVYFHFLTPSFAGDVHLTADLECWIDGVVGGCFNLYPDGHNVIIHGSGVDRAGINNLESTSGGSITLEGVRVAGYLVGINDATGGEGSTINVTRSLVMGETYLYGSNGEAGSTSSTEIPATLAHFYLTFNPVGATIGESLVITAGGGTQTITIQSDLTVVWPEFPGWRTYASGNTVDYQALTSGSIASPTIDTPNGSFTFTFTNGADSYTDTTTIDGTNGGNAGTLNLVNSELLGQIHIAAGIGGFNASDGAYGIISARGSTLTPPSDAFTIPDNYNNFTGCWICEGPSTFRFYELWNNS
jgi:hypothetical protein